MTLRNSYHLLFTFECLSMIRRFKLVWLISLSLLISLYALANTEESIDIELSPVISFDEVAVDFNVNNLLKFENDVIISESNSVYINIEELFNNLDIKCTPSKDGNVLQGFIGDESRNYIIDYNAKQIKLGKKTVKSVNGFLKESGNIYIESTIITKVFGLNVIFNFRALSIKMDSNFELPIQKRMRLDQMRANTSRLQYKSEVAIDTVIGRDYHLFNAGVLDWSISSTQVQQRDPNNKLRLRAGSELLFGEATVGVDLYNQIDFNRHHLYYNWRWIDNDNTMLRQAEVGKVGVQSISYLSAPLVGVSVNNSPNTIRKASGSYVVSDYTEPNWTVELYINDILVDYTEADASGYFLFEVPIVYGYTTLKMRFYGPLGEERFEERTMNTPYTLMPEGVLEYNATGGYVEDEHNSTFARGEVNYGINRFITVGGGVEYLSSISNHSYMPFAVLAFQPFSKLLVNLEYDHNVAYNGLFNYTFGRGAFFEIDYSKYVEGQQATLNTNNDALDLRLSVPMKMKKVSGNAKLTYTQLSYDEFDYTLFSTLLSSRYKNLSTNLTIASNWVSNYDPYVTATLEVSQRMRNGLVVRPMAQHSISNKEMMRAGVEFEKRFTKLSVSASYTREIKYKRDNIYFSLSYDLPFARTGITVVSNNYVGASEYAQGSVAFGGDHYTNTSNNTSIDKGGILFYPFVDENQNGIKDEGEVMVLLSNVNVSGGRAYISEKDSIVRVSGLNAFVKYIIEFRDDDLDNIAWQFEHKTYQVLVDPHQYKKVYIPILALGEISGMVYLTNKEESEGLARVLIQFIDNNGEVVGETLSESDGYYSYMGLKPGEYTVRMNQSQMEKLGCKVTSLSHNVSINMLPEGDVKGGVDFELMPHNLVALAPKESPKETIEEVTVAMVVKPEPKSPKSVIVNFIDINTTDDIFYTVQVGAYRNYVTADQLPNLAPIYYETLPDGTKRYFTGNYATAEEAVKARDLIIKQGVDGAYIMKIDNGKQSTVDGLEPKDDNSTTSSAVDIDTVTSQIDEEMFSDSTMQMLNEPTFSSSEGAWDNYGKYATVLLAVLVPFGAVRLLKRKS